MKKYEGRIPLYWTEGRLLDRYHYTRILNGIKRNWATDAIWGNVDLVTNIGFPLYVTNILGAWKLLGVIAILMPGLPRLKEWAYSGIFFS